MEQDKLNILITGARGFIGKNLVEYLINDPEEKFAVFYPYHKELELLDSSKVAEFIKDNNIDVIIHGANIGGTRKTGYDTHTKEIIVYKNIKMFFNLANTLNNERKMIFLGSGAEFDMRYYKPKMAEDYFGTHIPEDAYGFSKYICAKYIENSTNIVNLRLFGVFGKYEDYEYKFISNAIVKNLMGFPIVINQNVYFDYLYINDLIRVIKHFIHNEPRYRTYNVTPVESIDIVTIANKINQIAEKSSEIIVVNPGLNTEYSGDNRRLLAELGDEGYFTSYDEGLKELYTWYKKNMDKIDKNIIEKDEYIKHCRVRE